MKTFECSHCGHLVFFENVVCENCGSALGYLPDSQTMAAFTPDPGGVWTTLGTAAVQHYRPCQNYTESQVCNWMVAADDPDPLCCSCRYTAIIPQLSQPENLRYWYLLEAAKRHLFYTLNELGLAIPSRSDDPARGLTFHFLESRDPQQHVVTGHDAGLITLNIAEANDAEREARRTAMGEPYRTLLGHFRHEIGHFYWEYLVTDGPWLEPFRALFGDETMDYDAALKRHYAQGPAADWNAHFISSYATMHPWEDWAETWAHYLHIIDALKTAHHWGVSIAVRAQQDTTASMEQLDLKAKSFSDVLVNQWLPLAQFLNSMNRSLGQHDSYPFVLSDAVIAKLDFIDRLVQASRGMPYSAWPPDCPMTGPG